MSRSFPHKPKGTRALRRGRYSGSNHIYHVTTVTRGREKIFEELACGRILVEALKQESSRNCETLCFMIMPDHLHWLVQLHGTATLAGSVNRVKSQSARRINSLRATSGSIWQKGFHDHALRRDEDLVAVARYIIANPVRAGLVRRIEDYSLWDAVWVR
jgi:putative transposase